jgi:hypothetical protein
LIFSPFFREVPTVQSRGIKCAVLSRAYFRTFSRLQSRGIKVRIFRQISELLRILPEPRRYSPPEGPQTAFLAVLARSRAAKVKCRKDHIEVRSRAGVMILAALLFLARKKGGNNNNFLEANQACAQLLINVRLKRGQ